MAGCLKNTVCRVTSSHEQKATPTFPWFPSLGAPATTSVAIAEEKCPAVTAYPRRGVEKKRKDYISVLIGLWFPSKSPTGSDTLSFKPSQSGNWGCSKNSSGKRNEMGNGVAVFPSRGVPAPVSLGGVRNKYGGWGPG